MKKISICMTHYNRKHQLLNTLRSIEIQKNAKDLTEIIVVDDVSRDPLVYSDFNGINLDIKLISIQTQNKWWINPCIAFNAAFNFIDSPITIIQNAECLHATNIIEYVLENLTEGKYIAMSALNLSRESSIAINTDTNISDINTTNSSWYCHPIHRPDPFNFCAAIHTEYLKKAGGFDNRFSKGIYYDDDAFLHRLRSVGVECHIEESQVVYHQWHEQIWESLPNKHELGAINRNLLANL